MKPLLNTLYVTTQGSWISRDGETVAVKLEKQTLLQVPVHTLSGIVCFGQVYPSTDAFWLVLADRSLEMSYCGAGNIELRMMSCKPHPSPGRS
jgi:CRISP-associated protein Cas1